MAFWNEARQRWCEIVELPVGLDGKRRRKTFFAKSMGEVKKKAERYQPSGVSSNPDATVSDLADAFMAKKCRGEEPLRPNTEANYRYLVDKLIKPIIGALRVSKLEEHHIEGWLDQLKKGGWPRTDEKGEQRTDKKGQVLLEKPKGPALREDAFIMLGSLLTYGRERKMLAGNPMEFVRAPSPPEKKILFLNREEIARFLTVVRNEDQFPFFYLTLYAGLRVGETLALQWEDVDFEAGIIRVRHTLLEVKRGRITKDKPCECCGVLDGRGPTKTRSGVREIKVTPEIITALRNQQKRLLQLGLRICPWAFPTRKGTPQIQRNVQRLLKRLLFLSGIPKKVSLHGLRHSAATLMITMGTNTKMVQQRLGHGDSKMMDRYVHAAEEHEEIVAQKLAGFFAGVGGG